MNWYNVFKFSALEQNWWQNFYDHLTKATPFVVKIDGVTTRFVSSGVDGNKIWYTFMAARENDRYTCSVRFEFSQSIPQGGGETVWKNDKGEVTWQSSTLHQVIPKGNTELVKLNWSVIKNMNLGHNGAELIGQGFILAQNATPVLVLTQIKNAILGDMYDNEDDGPDDTPPVDSPVPSDDSYVPAPVAR